MEEKEAIWKDYENFVMEQVDCRKLVDGDEQLSQILAVFDEFIRKNPKYPICISEDFVKEKYTEICTVIWLKKNVHDGTMEAEKKNGEWIFNLTDKGRETVRKIKGGLFG